MLEFIMLIGLPGSGKSTYRKNFNGYDIHSSDDIREELNTNDPWEEMHKRTQQSLKEGRSVVYDATNLSRKKRRNILSIAKGCNAKTIAIVFATPFIECLERNERRQRRVPICAMNRMIKTFNMPTPHEFDEVKIVQNSIIKLNFITDIAQDSPHHSLKINEHLEKANVIALKKYPNDLMVHVSALFHDIGKPFCKTFINTKGETTDIAHYYGHENVGAYYYLTSRKANENVLFVTQLINYHMRPYIWKKSSKAKERDKKDFGKELTDKVLKLHKCDILAH